MERKVQNLVVGFSGKAGSGKDTFYSLVREEYRRATGWSLTVPTLERDFFAFPIKAAYSAMFDIPMEELDREDFKKQINGFTGATHRKELQLLGTEFYRDRTGNPDIWIQLLISRINNRIDSRYLRETIPVAMITDVRFENEAKFIKEHGILIRIIRPGVGEVDNPSHPSEVGFQTPVDVEVDNCGTITELREVASEFVTEVLMPRMWEQWGTKFP